MRWIIGIYIVIDVIFNNQGSELNRDWYMISEMTHFLFVLAIAVYFFKDKIIAFLYTPYLLIVLATIIYNYLIGVKLQHSFEPDVFWSILSLSLFMIYLIREAWER